MHLIMEVNTSTSLVQSGHSDFKLEFETEKIKFMASPMWGKLLKDFVQTMKLDVADGDVEDLKKFLRKKRTECLASFKTKGCFYIWNKCFDMTARDFDGGLFMKKMHACNEDGIDANDLEDVFSYVCLTYNIDLLLQKVFAIEKNDKSSSAITILFQQIVYNSGTIQFNSSSPVDNTQDEDDEEEILRNIIFSDRLFNTNDKLHRLRNEIAKSIDFDDYNPVFGDVDRPKINPAMQNEWYYIWKGISESSVCGRKISVQNFIEQMIAWYPWAFATFSNLAGKKAFMEKMGKSISHERKLWKYGPAKEEVPIKDMWAKWKSLYLDYAKVYKFQPVCKDLYHALQNLKSAIEQEEAAKGMR